MEQLKNYCTQNILNVIACVLVYKYILMRVFKIYDPNRT